MTTRQRLDNLWRHPKLQARFSTPARRRLEYVLQELGRLGTVRLRTRAHPGVGDGVLYEVQLHLDGRPSERIRSCDEDLLCAALCCLMEAEYALERLTAQLLDSLDA